MSLSIFEADGFNIFLWLNGLDFAPNLPFEKDLFSAWAESKLAPIYWRDIQWKVRKVF